MDRSNTIIRLADYIRRELPNDAVVAAKPDHPLLIAGPDILVGVEGKLSAIFFPKAREIARPKALDARLIGSKLALPSHTMFILGLGGKDDVNDATRSNFDYHIEEKTQSDTVKLLSSEFTKSSSFYDELAYVRTNAMSRYSSLLHLYKMHKIDTFREKNVFHQSEYDSLQGERLYGSNTILRRGAILVGLKKHKSRRELSVALNEYSIQSLNDNYHIKSGIPQRHGVDFHIALYQDPVMGGFDPEKPLRVAAFSGWMLARSESISDFDNYLSSINKSYDKTLTIVKRIQEGRRL